MSASTPTTGGPLHDGMEPSPKVTPIARVPFGVLSPNQGGTPYQTPLPTPNVSMIFSSSSPKTKRKGKSATRSRRGVNELIDVYEDNVRKADVSDKGSTSLRSLTPQAVVLGAKFNSHMKGFDKAGRENVELKKKVTALEKKVAQLSSENARLKSDYEMVESKWMSTFNENIALKNQVEDYSLKIEDIELQLQSMQIANESLKTELESQVAAEQKPVTGVKRKGSFKSFFTKRSNRSGSTSSMNTISSNQDVSNVSYSEGGAFGAAFESPVDFETAYIALKAELQLTRKEKADSEAQLESATVAWGEKMKQLVDDGRTERHRQWLLTHWKIAAHQRMQWLETQLEFNEKIVSVYGERVCEMATAFQSVQGELTEMETKCAEKEVYMNDMLNMLADVTERSESLKAQLAERESIPPMPATPASCALNVQSADAGVQCDAIGELDVHSGADASGDEASESVCEGCVEWRTRFDYVRGLLKEQLDRLSRISSAVVVHNDNLADIQAAESTKLSALKRKYDAAISAKTVEIGQLKRELAQLGGTTEGITSPAVAMIHFHTRCVEATKKYDEQKVLLEASASACADAQLSYRKLEHKYFRYKRSMKKVVEKLEAQHNELCIYIQGVIPEIENGIREGLSSAVTSGSSAVDMRFFQACLKFWYLQLLGEEKRHRRSRRRLRHKQRGTEQKILTKLKLVSEQLQREQELSTTLRKECVDRSQVIQSLNERLETWQKRSADTIGELEQSLSLATAGLKKSNKDMVKMQSRKAALEKELQGAVGSKRSSDEKISSLESERDALNAELVDTKHRVEALERELEGTVSMARELEGRHDDLSKQLQSKSHEMETLSIELQQAHTAAAESEAAREVMASNLVSANEDARRVHGLLEEQVAIANAAEDEQQSLLTALLEAETRLENLRNEIAAAEFDSETGRDKNQDQSIEISDLVQETGRLRDELNIAVSVAEDAESQKAFLVVDLIQAYEQIALLEDEVHGLSIEVERVEDAKAVMAVHLARAHSYVQALEQEIEDMSNEGERAEDDKACMVVELARAEQAVEELQSRIAELESAAEEASTHKSNSEKELAALRLELSATQEKLSETTGALTAIEKQKVALEKNMLAKSSELDSLTESLSIAKSALMEGEEQRRVLCDEIDAAKADLDTAATKLTASETKNEAAQGELKDAKAACKRLQESVNALEADVETETIKSREMDGQVRSLEGTVNELYCTISGLNETVSTAEQTLKSSSDQYERRLREASAKIEELERGLASANEQLFEKTCETEKLEERVIALDDQLCALRSQHTESKDVIAASAGVMRERDALIQKLREENRDRRVTIEALQADRAVMDMEHSNLQMHCQFLETEMEHAHAEIGSLQTHVSELQKYKTLCNDLEADTTALQGALEELRDVVDDGKVRFLQAERDAGFAHESASSVSKLLVSASDEIVRSSVATTHIQTRMDTLGAELVAREEEIGFLRNQLSAMEDQNARLSSALSLSEEDSANFHKKLLSASKEIVSVKQFSDSESARADAAEVRAIELEAKIGSHVDEIRGLEDELAVAQGKLCVMEEKFYEQRSMAQESTECRESLESAQQTLQSTVESLRSDMDSKVKQLTHMKDANAALETQLSELTSSHEVLKTEAAQLRDENGMLSVAVSSKTDEASCLSQALDTADAEIASLKTRLADESARANTLEKSLAVTRQELSEQKAASSKMEAEIRSGVDGAAVLATQKAALEDRIHSLEGELAAKSEESDRQAEHLKTLESQVKLLAGKSQDLDERMQSDKAEIATLQGALKASEAKQAAQLACNQSLLTLARSAEDLLKSHEAEVQSMDEQKQALQSMYDASTHELSALREQLNCASTEGDERKQTLESMVGVMRERDSMIVKLRDENRDRRVKYEQLTSAYQKLEAQSYGRTLELEVAQASVQRLEVSLQKAQGDYQQLAKYAQEVEDECTRLRVYEDLCSSIQSETESLQSTMALVQESMDTHRQRAQAETELRAHTEECADSVSRLLVGASFRSLSLDLEIDALRSERTSLVKSLSSAELQLKDLSSRLSQSETDLTDLRTTMSGSVRVMAERDRVIQDLRVENRDRRLANETLIVQLENRDVSIAHLQQEMQRQAYCMHAMHDELQAKESTISSLRASFSELESTCSVREEMLQEIKRDASSFNGIVEEIASEKEQLQSAVEHEAEAHAKCRSASASMTKFAVQSADEIQGLRSALSAEAEKIDELNSTIDWMENENDSLRSQCTLLETRLSRSKAENRKLNKTIDWLEDENHRLTTNLEVREEELKTVRSMSIPSSPEKSSSDSSSSGEGFRQCRKKSFWSALVEEHDNELSTPTSTPSSSKFSADSPLESLNNFPGLNVRTATFGTPSASAAPTTPAAACTETPQSADIDRADELPTPAPQKEECDQIIVMGKFPSVSLSAMKFWRS